MAEFKVALLSNKDPTVLFSFQSVYSVLPSTCILVELDEYAPYTEFIDM